MFFIGTLIIYDRIGGLETLCQHIGMHVPWHFMRVQPLKQAVSNVSTNNHGCNIFQCICLHHLARMLSSMCEPALVVLGAVAHMMHFNIHIHVKVHGQPSDLMCNMAFRRPS